MFDLHPYQQADVDSFIAETSYGGLNATGVGGGKTLVATEISRLVDARKIIIVAPKNTERGWRRHFMIQRDMPVQRVGGSTKEQKQAFMDMSDGKPGAFFMSWEYFRALGWKDYAPDLFIADEVHRAQNRRSQQALAYHSLAHATFYNNPEGRVLALSGTPAGNHMSGIWSVARGLWPEMYSGQNEKIWKPGGLPYWKWCDRWFRMEVNPYSGYKDPTVEVRPGALMASLPYYVRHTQGEACCRYHPRGLQADLPPVVEHEVTVTLTPLQRRMYKEMLATTMVWMEDHDWPIESGGWPLVEHMRLLQICLGTPKVETLTSYNSAGEIELENQVTFPLDCKSSKIDATIDILTDAPAGEPFIVWTHSTALIPALVDRINRAFPKGEHRATRWDGTVSGRSRDAILDGFGKGGPNIIVAQIAALAEGVDGLQLVCHNEIIVSKSSNNLHNAQAFGGINGGGRIDRPGQTQTINRWVLMAEDTIEEDKAERLDYKESQLAKGLRI